MSSLNLVFAPSPILKKKADKVSNIDKETKRLIHGMYDIMYENNGVGLAAPQVNHSVQILVMDCTDRQDNSKAKALINPVIKSFSKNIKAYEEGCLSFPGHYFEVSRPDTVEISYLNIDGEERTHIFNNFESVCVQHEIDHLLGTLFVEYLSMLRRNIIIRKMQKFKKNISKQKV